MVHTVSCDEKYGKRAIVTTSDYFCPTTEIGYVYLDAECKQFGMLSLLAGIDFLTGIAITVVSETHKSFDFMSLLKKFDEMYLTGDIIRIVSDNHFARRTKEMRNYLFTLLEGRFVFVFTLKHGSWLNLVESFFGKMTKQMLKGIRVQPKQELEKRIYLCFDEVNKEPAIYHWTYKLDEISSEEAESVGIKSDGDIAS